MFRRQILLVVLFGVIFQIFFSITNTLTIDEDSSFEPSIISNSTNKCEPVSIDEFPPLFFTNEQRRRGGVLLHIALILYSFAAIEIVCDDYFASALEKISYNLNLTPVGFPRHLSFPSDEFLGCRRSNIYGISYISIGIFYIDCRSIFC